jgi:V/A-type H+-transporting ATPase subunit A
MMSALMAFYDKAGSALNSGADIEKLVALPVRERIGRLKYVSEENVKSEFDEIIKQLESELDEAVKSSKE